MTAICLYLIYLPSFPMTAQCSGKKYNDVPYKLAKIIPKDTWYNQNKEYIWSNCLGKAHQQGEIKWDRFQDAWQKDKKKSVVSQTHKKPNEKKKSS